MPDSTQTVAADSQSLSSVVTSSDAIRDLDLITGVNQNRRPGLSAAAIAVGEPRAIFVIRLPTIFL